MKKIIFVLVAVLLSPVVFSQADTIQAPYKRYPGFPPIKLLLPDSLSFYTKQDLPKKTAVMLMLFSPGCEHCRHETEHILRSIDQFKDIHIIMATTMPHDSMMSFRETFRLADHANIVVGQDTHFFLPGYYSIRNLPFLAFYNRKKELISVSEGPMPVQAILEVFKTKE